MADSTETITISLVAEDNASSTIAAVGAALERLGTGLDLGGIQGQLTGLGSALSGVGNTGLGALPDQVRALGTSLQEAVAPAQALSSSLQDVATQADAVGTRMATATDAVRTALAGQTDAVRQALAQQTQLVQQAALAQGAAAAQTATMVGGLGLGAGALGALAGAAAVHARDAQQAEQAAILAEPARPLAPTLTSLGASTTLTTLGVASAAAATPLPPLDQAAAQELATKTAALYTPLGKSAEQIVEEAGRVLAGMKGAATAATDAAAAWRAYAADAKTMTAGGGFRVGAGAIMGATTEGEAARGIVGGIKPEDVVPPVEPMQYESLGLGGLFSWWKGALFGPGATPAAGPSGPGAIPQMHPAVQALLNQGQATPPAPPAGTSGSGGGGFFDLPWGSGGTGEGEAPGAGFLKETAQIGGSFLIWGTLFSLFSRGQQALTGLASGLITTNVAYQTLEATLSSLYGSSGAGKAALDWVDALAEKLPETREQVRQAAVTLASAGVPLQSGLPAVAELTAAVHPTGGIQATSQAVVDAMAGRTEMLRVSLRTQVESLRDFGLEAEKSGHIVESTFVPALDRYVQARFGAHMAEDAGQVAAAGTILAGTGAAAATLTDDVVRLSSSVDVKAADGAKALAEAYQGHFGALQQTFGITVAMLQKGGLDLNNVAGTIAGAFETVVQTDFGGALLKNAGQLSSVQLQMATLGGAATNLVDVWQGLERTLGQGVTSSLQQALTGFGTGQMKPGDQLGGVVGALGDQQGLGGALQGAAQELSGALGSALDHLIGQLGDWYQQMGGFPGLLLLVTNGWKEFSQAVQTAWSVLQGVGTGLGVVFSAIQTLWSAWAPILSGLGTALDLVGRALGGLFGFGTQSGQGMQTLVAGLTAAVVGMRLLSFGVGAVTSTFTDFTRVLGLNSEALAANAAAQTVTTAAATTAASGGLLAQVGAGLARPLSVGVPALAAADLPLLSGAMGGLNVITSRLTGSLGMATLGVGAFLADFYLVPEAFKELTTYIYNLAGIDLQGRAPAVRAALEPSSVGATPGTWSYIPAAGTTGTAPPTPTGTPPAGSATPGPTASVLPPPGRWVYTPGSTSPQDQFEAYLQTQPGAFKQYSGGGWAFNRMVDTDNPQYWAQWLAQHPSDPITKQYLSLLPATAPAGIASQQSVRAVMTAALPGQAATAYTQENAALQQLTRDKGLLAPNLPGDVALAAELKQGVDTARGGMTQDQINADITATYHRLAQQYKVPDTLAPPDSQKPPSYGADTYAQNLQQVQAHLTADIARGLPASALQADYGQVRAVAQRGERAGYADADAVFMALHQAQDAIAQHIKAEGQKAEKEAGETLSWQELVHAPLSAVTDTIAKAAAGLKQEGDSATQIALQKVQMIEAAGKDQLQYDSETKASFGQIASDTAWIAQNLHAAGLSMAEATRLANKMRDDAIKAGHDQESKAAYTLALGQGRITSLGQIPGYVNAIMATEPSTAGPNQRALDQYQLNKQGQDAVLKNAKDHLDFDIGAHASMTQLQADENAYLKILAVEMGGTGSWAYKLGKQQIDAQIAGTKSIIAAIGAPPPQYARFGGVATAYGSATVSFGGVRDHESATLRELRLTNEHLRDALQRDDRLITTLEAELVVGRAQLGALRSIDQHVTPPPPSPAQSVHAHIKARGGFMPMAR